VEVKCRLWNLSEYKVILEDNLVEKPVSISGCEAQQPTCENPETEF
jgi:hypothetical protein